MNTQKQIVLIVALFFIFTGSCAAYTAIDLPYRAEMQKDYQHDESVERGALLFANNCRTCHGDRGQGGVGLQLNKDAFREQEPLVLKANQDLIRRTLYCGRAGSLMQPWLNTNGGALNAIQIDHIVDFLTEPIDLSGKTLDEEKNPTSKGWFHAVEFSHNLNHEGSAVVGGDSLGAIAKAHLVGQKDILDLNPGLAIDQPLKKGTRIKLPANPAFPNGRTYKVTQKNETLLKIIDNQHVGDGELAELNGIRFKFDPKKNVFSLLNEDGKPITGLFPGQKLKLPDDSSYVAVVGDSGSTIAEAHGITFNDLRALNDSLKGVGSDAEVKVDETNKPVFKLPKGAIAVVKGQSLADVAKSLGNVTADSLAEANKVNATDVIRIGEALKLPADAWGSAPAGALNTGTACVQNAVPASVFKTLPGVGTPEPAPTVPATQSKAVVITANANDWTVAADGQAQTANKGVIAIARGVAVEFKVAVGLHNITINGKQEGADIKQGDVRTVTFNTAGDFKITCSYHPDMLAYIFVQ